MRFLGRRPLISLSIYLHFLEWGSHIFLIPCCYKTLPKLDPFNMFKFTDKRFAIYAMEFLIIILTSKFFILPKCFHILSRVIILSIKWLQWIEESGNVLPTRPSIAFTELWDVIRNRTKLLHFSWTNSVTILSEISSHDTINKMFTNTRFVK